MTPEACSASTSPPGPRATIWWRAPGGCWGSRASDTRGRSIPRAPVSWFCSWGRTAAPPPFPGRRAQAHTGTFRLGITTATDDAAGARIAEHGGPLLRPGP